MPTTLSPRRHEASPRSPIFTSPSAERKIFHSQLIKFVVVSDQRVDVTFEVQRDGTKTTTCVLRAQNVHHADVGYATVTITPGRDYVQPTYALATSGRADTAEVLGCSENGPPHVDPPQFAPGTVNPPQQPTISGT